uniref:Uncharacterized protein n=1 Tax=Anguilla anguilla TaxID=7936 RepID=A0A0E9QW56_ANGAN
MYLAYTFDLVQLKHIQNGGIVGKLLGNWACNPKVADQSRVPNLNCFSTYPAA